MPLYQDYQEEIGEAQENKQQLQIMGARLAGSSQESKAAEIQHKLGKVSERWQHLLDLIAARWVYKTRKSSFRALFVSRVLVANGDWRLRQIISMSPKVNQEYGSNYLWSLMIH